MEPDFTPTPQRYQKRGTGTMDEQVRTDETPNPKSPTWLWRSNHEDQLRGRFERFMEDATGEEKLLLDEILDCREVRYPSTRVASETGEIPLAGAFKDATEWETESVFKVPESISDDVAAYIKSRLALVKKSAH
jgi:hypothetical protein